jgi:hypothetical protein
MTDTPIAIEVNCETGEVVERPLTAEEIAAQVAAAEQAAKEQAVREEEAKVAAEQKAAIAERLGLTQEELALLLG